MGCGSRDHRIKLTYGKRIKRFVKRFEKFDSSEDDEVYKKKKNEDDEKSDSSEDDEKFDSSEDDELLVLEQGGNYGEHNGDKKIKEKNEISETVITINHQLQKALLTLKPASKPSTIGRAPPRLRRLHEHGFNPTHVAIGPLHRPAKHLSFMEVHKLRFLVRLLDKMTLPHVHDQEQNSTSVKAVEELVSQQPSDQTAGSSSSSSSTNANEKKIEYLVVAMKGLEAYTRACYAGTFDISSNEFVMMMILDSCFVVELLRLYAKWGFEKVNEPIFNSRWVVPTLKHDLLMLENQLPLKVLKKMFQITQSREDRFDLNDLTLKFFNSLLSREKAFSGMCRVDIKPDHLLGLFRSSFQVRKLPRNWSSGSNRSRLRSWVRILSRGIHSAIKNIKTCLRIRQTDRQEQDPSPPWVHERKLLIHCVTELKEAGISFEKREKHELLDIDFKNGKLYIPPLLIDDYTGVMFLNFVAYEQCNPLTEPYFTTYLLFWDSLLNSAKDVEYLHSKGIIDHVLGSDEDVAQLFNKLCREVAHDLGDCYLSKVFEDVNQYFGVRRHRWRAKWKHDYFNSPWAFLSLIAAVVLLILTFIQTLFTVFSYVLPP